MSDSPLLTMNEINEQLAKLANAKGAVIDRICQEMADSIESPGTLARYIAVLASKSKAFGIEVKAVKKRPRNKSEHKTET